MIGLGEAARRWWGTETRTFLGLWLALLVVGQTQMLRDPGTLWHTVVGERILQSGQLVRVDPFSFTCDGEPWIAMQWLGELMMAAVHRMGGIDSLLVAAVTVLAACYTWITSRLLRAGCHTITAILVVTITIAASSYHFHVRPHLASIALIGYVFASLCDVEAGRTTTARLWLLVPMLIMWTNLHAGALGGVGTIVLVVLGWGAAACIGWPSPVRSIRQFVGLIVLAVTCSVTIFVNPFGVQLPKVWVALSSSKLLQELIVEHAPLRLDNIEDWGVVLCAVLYFAVLAGTLPRRPTITALLPIVWLMLSCSRIRHGPLFAVVATLSIAELIPHCRWMHWLAEHGSDFCRLLPRPAANFMGSALVPALAVATSMILHATQVPLPVIGSGWARLSPENFPTELVAELQRFAGENRDGTPIFNDLDFGGFVIYFAPTLRVFIDDRCELYGEDRLRQYDEARTRHPERIDEWQERYGFQLALTHTGSPFDQYLAKSDRWREWMRTTSAVLYRRARQWQYANPMP